MSAKIYQFPMFMVDTKPYVQPEQTEQNDIYAKLKLEYLKETGCWITTGAFEKWLRDKHYYDDYYLPYWKEYKQEHHNKHGDCREDYEKWLGEEVCKDQYEEAHEDYFKEELMALQDKDPEYQAQKRIEDEKRKVEEEHENIFIQTFCTKLSNKLNKQFKSLGADLRVKHYKDNNSIIFYGSCFYEVNIYKFDLTFINEQAYRNFDYDSMIKSFIERYFEITENILKYFQEDYVTELNLYGKLGVRFNQPLRNVIRQLVKKGYINLEDTLFDYEVCFVSKTNSIYCYLQTEELLKFI